MAEYTLHSSMPQLGDTGRAENVEQWLGRHDGLVHAVIRREGSGALTYEEALQAGRIGLWRAVLGYDPGRGCTVHVRYGMWTDPCSTPAGA